MLYAGVSLALGVCPSRGTESMTVSKGFARLAGDGGQTPLSRF